MAIGTSAGEYFEDHFDYMQSKINGSPITSDLNTKSESYPSSQDSQPGPVRGSQSLPEASYEGSNPPDNPAKLSIIRHGATEFNAEGNKLTSQDKIRGHLDIPLNDVGRQEAKDLGDEIAKSKDKPDLLVSSDLKRAHDTAKIISDKTGIPLTEVSNGFRPWDVGEFSGKPSKDVIPKMLDYMEHKPDEPVPGGESFNQFKDRALSNISRVVQDNPGKHIGIVTHHRVGQLMEALDQKTGEVDPKTFGQKGKAPGTVVQHEFKMAGDVLPFPPGGSGGIFYDAQGKIRTQSEVDEYMKNRHALSEAGQSSSSSGSNVIPLIRPR